MFKTTMWAVVLVGAAALLGLGKSDVQAADRFLTLPHPAASDGSMWIQQGWNYTSGSTHKGFDIIRGTPDKSPTWKAFTVLAAAPGIVDTVNTNPNASSWGKYVIIRHRKTDFSPQLSTDYFTVYAHLDNSYVTRGNTISRGAPVGYAGKTGAANGVIHLHWECHKSSIGNKVDPFAIYDKRDFYPRWPNYRTDPAKRAQEDRDSLFTTIPPRSP